MKFREEWENELRLVPDKKSSSKKKKDTSEDPVAKLWKLSRPTNNPQYSGIRPEDIEYKIIPKANFSIELYVQGKKFFGEGETKGDAKRVAAQEALENLFGSNENGLNMNDIRNCKNPVDKLNKLFQPPEKPQYRSIPSISIELRVDGKMFFGEGETKKDAERMAAQKALESLILESKDDGSGSQ